MFVSTLEILPMEIFHYILNYLDTPSIFHSFDGICQRLNGFVNWYKNYKLDLSCSSRSTFERFLLKINSKNIISLILSDDDRTPGQIGLFLSLINLKELHRLRCLSLLQIEECHLILFIKNGSFRNLKSLSIQWRGDSLCDSNHFELLSLLSTLISSPNLRHLDLTLWIYEIKNLSWPNNCTLTSLSIDNCSFSEYRHILQHSPDLKRFTMHDRSMFNITDPFIWSSNRCSYDQLQSLSLNNLEKIQMISFIYLLSLTPSLVHLQLIGYGCLEHGAFDGQRWEDFIRNNLHCLKTFQFCFLTKKYGYQTDGDVQLLITPFFSRFWKENNSWFVQCDFMKSFSQIRLYSIPICHSYFEYTFQSDIISQSTFNDSSQITNNHVNILTLYPSTTIMESKNDPIFPRVTELILESVNEMIIVSFQFYSTLFNPLHLVKISLNISSDYYSNGDLIDSIRYILQQTSNLHTFHNRSKDVDVEILCGLIPSHVKHFQMKTDRLNDMKMIVEQLDHLSSITFQYSDQSSDLSQDFLEWFYEKETLFTFRGNPLSLHLWIDNQTRY